MKRMMKRTVLFVSCLVMLLSCMGALAESYSDNYPLYKVESYSPNGYCYLYSQPSDITGRNLGRYNNGEYMKVIDFNYKNGYAKVVCAGDKVGYVHNYSITPYKETNGRTLYRVYSTQPAGYCYLYDRASDIRGRNMGRYDNGAIVQMVDWDEDATFAKVKIWNDGKYGYIRKTCLVLASEDLPYDNLIYVNSVQPRGYCYLYDRPSSIKGVNLGRHNNGEEVYLIDWDVDATYALVECQNGKIGYINKNSLSR